MSDYAVFQRGAVRLPLTAATTNSALQDADPALYYALAYLSAMITTHAGGRLLAEAALCGAPITSAVQQVCSFDPQPVLTQAQFKFPLLAVYRKSAIYNRVTIARPHNADQWEAMYVLPTLTAGQMQRLIPILHAIGAILDDRIVQGRDPSYSSGSKVWALTGVEEISLDRARYGRVEDISSDLWFPAWIGEMTVKERAEKYEGAFHPLAGIDVSIPVLDTATNTQTATIGAFSTSTPAESPGDIPNCKLWLRASVGVAVSGKTVTSWCDRSGNAQSAVPTGQPTLLASATNGQPAISFDGSTQALTVAASSLLHPTTGCTLFVVYRARTQLAAGQSVIACQSSTTLTDGYGLVNGPTLGSGNLEFFVNAGATHYGGGGGTDAGTWQLAVGVYDETNVTLYLNGVQTGTQSAYSTPIAYTSNPQLVIGAMNLSTGGGGGLTRFAPIDVAEVGLYSRALTTAELASLTTMMTAQYALGA